MMMVPVIVVMGGTFAFSAWSGSANSFFDQSAATVSYTETLSFVHTNAVINPLKVGNVNGYQDVNYTTGSYVISKVPGGVASTLNVYVNVSNLVPGDYAQFQVIINNTGSATLNMSEMSFSKTTYNANNQVLNGLTPISGLQPPVTSSYLSSVVANGVTGFSGDMLFLVNATTPNSTNGYVAPGQSISYTVYAILPTNAPSSFNDVSSGLYEISIPVSTIQ